MYPQFENAVETLLVYIERVYLTTKGWLCSINSCCMNDLISVEIDFDPGNEISAFHSFSPSAGRL